MSMLAWPLLLLACGIILLMAEVFIPSGGLIGVIAAFCLFWSLWLAFQQSTTFGLRFLAADVVLLPGTFMLAMYLWPKTPMAKRVFLRPPGPEDYEVSHSLQRLDHLIGQVGKALTPLRPSGIVDFDGRRLDGLSEDGLIATGSPVLAVRIRSGQLVVRSAPSADLRGIDLSSLEESGSSATGT